MTDVVPAVETTDEDPMEGVTVEDAGLGNTSTEVATEEEPTDGKTVEDAGLGKTSTETAAVVEPTDNTVENSGYSAGSVDLETFMKEKVDGQPRGDIQVTLKDKIGKTVGIDGDTVNVKPGDKYTLDYHVEVYKAGIPSGTTAYTNLPGCVTYQVISNKKLTDNKGNTLGTWSLDAEGHLVFNFTNTSGVQDYAFTAHFELTFDEVNAEIDIDDLHIIIVPDDKPKTGIKKTATKAENGRLKWTVTVTNENGATSVGTTLTDTLLFTYAASHFKDVDKTAGVIVDAYDPDGNKKTSWNATTADADHFSWTSNTGWSYKIPASMNGVSFGPNWNFVLTFYSTRDYVSTSGAQSYENKIVTSDNRKATGHIQIFPSGVGKATKRGNLTGDVFNWTITKNIVSPNAKDTYVFYDSYRYVVGNSGVYWGYGFERSSDSWRVIPGSMVVTFTPASTGEAVTIPEFSQGAQTSGLCYRLVHNNTGKTTDYQWNLTLGQYTSSGGFKAELGLTEEGVITISYQTPYDAEVMQTLFNKGASKVRNVVFINKNGDRENNLTWDVDIKTPDKTVVEVPDESNEYVETFSIEFVPPVDLADKDSHQLVVDTLTVTDTMSEYLIYLPGSLELSATDPDTGEAVQVNQPEVDQNGQVLNITISNASKYNYKITYKAKVNTAKAVKDHIANIPTENEFDIKVGDAVVASGKVEGTLSDWKDIAYAFHVKIKKVDEAGKALEGAKFGLYGADGKKFSDASDVVTDADGNGEFKTDVEKGVYFLRNALHYVQEIDAPEGYKVNKTKYWFVIDDPDFNKENRKTESEWKALIPKGDEFTFMTGDETTFEIANTRNDTSISGQKTWAYDNPDLRPESITVKLLANNKEVSGKSVTVKPDKNGNWKYEFTNLPISDADGVITYSVEEEPVPGYTAQYNGNDIVNEYNATGTASLEGNKTIKNREFKEGDKWTFKVSAVTAGAPMPEKTSVTINPTSGTSTDFSFGEINFKLEDMKGEAEKTFVYRIKESGTIAGVKNDGKTHTVSIKVTDDGKGSLTTVNTYKDGSATNNQKAKFVNTYLAGGTYHLEGIKTLTGRAFAEGDSWTFTVTAAEGTPMPENAEVTINPTEGDEANIDFGNITYGLADKDKTYTYTVTETGTVEGVTNDPANVKTVIIKVEDNGQGELMATATEESEAVEYNNTYNATGSTTLDGSKTIENRNFKEGDKWTFKVSAITKGAPMPKNKEVTINPTSGDSTNFTFGDINFKLANMSGAKEKTFKYKIEESGTIAGVTNDGGAHTVSIKVTDDGKGHLKAEKTYTDETEAGTETNSENSKFKNVYSSKGEYTLTGTKTITGRNFQAGDMWIFTVKAAKGTPMPQKTKVTITPKSGTTTSINFGKIQYSFADKDKTYTYTVTETGQIDGVTNDPVKVKTVKIKIVDDGNGGLTATATEDSETVAFTNTYNATGFIDLYGKKVLENRSFREGDKWTFEIEPATEGAPLPTVTKVDVTPTTGETEEEFDIGRINYVLGDLGGLDTKTFEYTITESGTVSGIVNDIKNTRTVKVKVTDKKDGTLEVVLAEDSEEATFINTHVNFSKQDVDGKEIKGATIQVLDESGTPVDQWVSKENESHEVKGLEAGKKYTMHEVSAPDGFTVTTDIVFMVDEDHKVKVIDQTTDGKTEVKDGKVIMTDEQTKVTFSKQDVDGVEIADAKIQILDEDSKVVDEWTSVEGESHELKGLVTGKKYTMHEVSAPDGFTVTTDITFTIDTDGTVKVIDQSTDGETIVEDGKIIMTDEKTKVTFSKQDVDGVEIGGAEIQILDEEGNEVDAWTSVEGESHELIGLVTEKQYTMHEVSSPETFAVATDITFTIDTDGTVKVIDQTTDGETIVEDGKVIMTDEKTTVQISKVDTESGKELEGAKLQIIDEDNNIVEEWTSTKEVHIVRGLKAGKKYILREQVAPLGYTLTTDTTFSIDAHNVVTSTGPVNKDGVILVNDTMTEVEILKVDSKTGKGLKGAKLQVLDDNGAVCEEWTSTKDAHKIRGLYTGVKYTLHEVEAPKGYDKAKDITFTIDTAGKVSSDALENGVVVMKDTPTPSKSKNKTGDEANGALWALLLLMAGGALGGTVWFKRKKRA